MIIMMVVVVVVMMMMMMMVACKMSDLVTTQQIWGEVILS